VRERVSVRFVGLVVRISVCVSACVPERDCTVYYLLCVRDAPFTFA
jgi:hypothetical protein